MKTKALFLGLLLLTVVGLGSCKGAGQKILEYGGKALSSVKNSKTAASTTYNNGKKAAIITSNQLKHIESCPYCDGDGVNFKKDVYGEPLRDSRGDYLLIECNRCKGTGLITK